MEAPLPDSAPKTELVEAVRVIERTISALESKIVDLEADVKRAEAKVNVADGEIKRADAEAKQLADTVRNCEEAVGIETAPRKREEDVKKLDFCRTLLLQKSVEKKALLDDKKALLDDKKALLNDKKALLDKESALLDEKKVLNARLFRLLDENKD
jgi:hypothetical protein